MNCPISDCKGTLVIQYRHSDLHPFIACSNYYVKGKPDIGCTYTEDLTDREIQLLKSRELTEREVIDLHFRNKAD